jgi:hypothetical protein
MPWPGGALPRSPGYGNTKQQQRVEIIKSWLSSRGSGRPACRSFIVTAVAAAIGQHDRSLLAGAAIRQDDRLVVVGQHHDEGHEGHRIFRRIDADSTFSSPDQGRTSAGTRPRCIPASPHLTAKCLRPGCVIAPAQSQARLNNLGSVRLQCALSGWRYCDTVNAPRVSAQDLRAAAEAHQELGPEYSDAIIDSFLEKLEARLDERVNARLSELKPRRKRSLPRLITEARSKAALAGITIGVAGVGTSLSLITSNFRSWYLGANGYFWALAALLIASAICCGAGLALAIRRGQ